MAIVTFDPAAFKTGFPEFGAYPDARLQFFFTMAEQSILDNTDNSPVMDVDYRTQLFNMLVGHMCLLLGNGVQPSPGAAPPGRLSSATEGTVSSSFEYILPPGSAMAAWFNQTKYGAMYWMATAQFRSARYFVVGNSGVGFARDLIATPVNTPAGILTTM